MGGMGRDRVIAPRTRGPCCELHLFVPSPPVGKFVFMHWSFDETFLKFNQKRILNRSSYDFGNEF